MINETISVDAGPAIGALDELAAAAARADEAMAKLKMPSFSGAGAGNMARGLDAAAAKVQAAVDKMEASFAKLKAVGAEAGAAMGDIGKAGAESAAGLGDASKAANDAAASYARLGKASRDSAAMMDEQAVASKRMGKASAEAGAASEGFFSRHKELVLGTGLALGYAVDKAMKFDASMTLLNTQAGVSAKQMPALTKGVLELAGATGQSPGNLAESLYHVASNMESMPGTTTAKMLNAVKIAAEGAATGHSNLTDTTTALTSVLASGIPGAKNYSQAMGVLNATVGVGEMNMQQLSDAMSTGVVPVVKGYGLTLKDVGAALATYGDLNIRGAHAGTELRMAVQALAVPASSAKKELAGLGLTTSTLATTMQKHGLLAALDQLDAKFKAHGITAKNEGQVITDLFGKKAGAGLALLLENMDRVRSKYPALTEGANKFGEAWNKTLHTPQQKLKQLEAGAQSLAITAGNVLMPAASGILGGLNKAFSFIQGNAFASKGVALGAGALVAGGLAKGLFSGVESGLSGLGKIGSALKIPGMDKLAGLGKTGADASLTAVATNGDAAAAALGRLTGAADGAAGAAGEGGILGAGGKASAAAEAEAEASMGLGGALRAGAGGLMAGGLVGALAIPLAMEADKAIQGRLGNSQASGLAQVGTGALAGAATGAAAGSVIPGLGTAVGAIAGALVGGVTTAMTNSTVWQELVHPAEKAGKPKYRVPSTPSFTGAPTELPGRGKPMPLPVPGSAKPAAPETFLYQRVHQFDENRHGIAHAYDQTRHGIASAGNFVAGSYDTTRHQVASFGQAFAELFGYRPPAPPKGPSVAPLGYTNQYPSGKPFYGEQPIGVAQPVAVTPSRGPTEMGIAAHAGAQLAIPAPKPIKIPPPDTSAVSAVKAKLTADVSDVHAKPIKLPAPDVSALTAAKGKAQSAGNAITSAITGALGKPVHAKAPDISAYRSAVGPARADGQNISAGLAAGIEAGKGAVVAAAADVAAAAAAAMAHAVQSHSPSKKTEKTGKDMTAGLVLGLQGGKPAVDAAAAALGKSAAKATDIAAIDAATKKLLSEVPKGDSALTRMLRADNRALDNMARTRSKLEQEISDSEQVAKSAVGGASIMNSLNAVNPAGAEPIASSAIITGQGYQATSLKQFAASLKKLQAMGLNATSLSQIAQAGPDQGLGIAQGIASGGKDAIKQLNSIQKQIQASSAAIGNIAGPAMYQAGKDVAKGLAAGLKSELGSLDKAMEHLAKAMASSVEKHAKTAKHAAHKAVAGTASGAASSAAAAVSGASAGSGSSSLTAAAAGLSHAGASLSAAAAALTGAAAALKGDAGAHGGGGGSHGRVPVHARPVAAGGYGGGGHYGTPVYLPPAAGQHVHYHSHVTQHVQGNIHTMTDLVDEMQNAFLNRGINNWQTGIIPPGRAG